MKKPAGHIETLPSGRRRARRGKKSLGVFDKLTQAQAALGIGTLTSWWPGYAVRRRKLIVDWRNEEGRWELYFAHAPIAAVPFGELSRKHAKAWLDSMLARGLAPQTIRNALNVGRAICADVQEAEQLELNPFRDLRVPKRYGVRAEEGFTVLDPDEQLALLDASDDEEWDTVAFSLHTGMRPFEVWKLTPADVDLEAEEVLVRGKRGKVRRIPLIGLARQAVQGAIANLRGEYLFPSPTTGEKRSDGSAPHHWHKWVKAAGIARRVRYYDLRHTCATALLAGWWGRKWSIDEVRQMLGHSSVKMTERYAHLVDETLRRAGRTTAGLIPEKEPTPPHETGADFEIRTRDLRFTKTLVIKGFHAVALRRHHERLAKRENLEGRIVRGVLGGVDAALAEGRGEAGAVARFLPKLADAAEAVELRGVH